MDVRADLSSHSEPLNGTIKHHDGVCLTCQQDKISTLSLPVTANCSIARSAGCVLR